MKVTSMDASSHYPDKVIHELYPIKPLKLDMNTTKEHLQELEDNGYAYVCKMRFHYIRLKDEFDPVPYISEHKCSAIVGLIGTDNGRVLSAEELTITCLDLDKKIIFSHYDFEGVTISDLRVSKYEPMIPEMIEYAKELFDKKTKLKNIPGKEEEYRCAKAKLNGGVYGLFVQKIENGCVAYDEENLALIDMPDISTDDEKVSAYVESCEKRPLPYRLGVWVSAWGRYRLQELIDIVGTDFIYCDTDSVKIINYENHKEEIDKLNRFYRDRAQASGSYSSDSKGELHYTGVFENEGTYDAFVTMGAKKYCTETDGEISLTLAGVPKDGAKELDTIDDFKPGKVFYAGKLRPVYNDADVYGEATVTDYLGNKGTAKITSNVCLVDTEYELNYSDKYEEVVKDPNKWVDEFTEAMFEYQRTLDKHNYTC